MGTTFYSPHPTPWLRLLFFLTACRKDFSRRAKKPRLGKHWDLARAIRTNRAIKVAKTWYVREKIDSSKNDCKQFCWEENKLSRKKPLTYKSCKRWETIPITGTTPMINEFFTTNGPNLARAGHLSISKTLGSWNSHLTCTCKPNLTAQLISLVIQMYHTLSRAT